MLNELFKLIFLFPANSTSCCVVNDGDRGLFVEVPTGQVVLKRQAARDSIQWKRSKTQFTELHVSSCGSIEAENGLLQVDSICSISSLVELLSLQLFFEMLSCG